ncbi:hypothetical protein BBD41_23105 [Paenibacillus ihbetae]|uniref:Uncharacterized protein n=1 Tax=Paenibacillus ihbetae TaxID=1870820 RepID=A0A1B2E5G4_9BACL|nr:hypothetical protein BBD41_23105 [Paenibacillus ihbetae]
MRMVLPIAVVTGFLEWIGKWGNPETKATTPFLQPHSACSVEVLAFSRGVTVGEAALHPYQWGEVGKPLRCIRPERLFVVLLVGLRCVKVCSVGGRCSFEV